MKLTWVHSLYRLNRDINTVCKYVQESVDNKENVCKVPLSELEQFCSNLTLTLHMYFPNPTQDSEYLYLTLNIL